MIHSIPYSKLTERPKVLSIIEPYLQKVDGGYKLSTDTLRSIAIQIAMEGQLNVAPIIMAPGYQQYSHILFTE